MPTTDLSERVFPCGNCNQSMKATVKEKTDKEGKVETTYLFTCKCGRKVEVPDGDVSKKKVLAEGKEAKKVPILEPEGDEVSIQEFMQGMDKSFGRV